MSVVSDYISNKKASVIVISAIAFCIILFLYRASIPFLKFPFLLLFGVLWIFLLISRGKEIIPAFMRMVKSMPVALILFGILILSAVFSDKIYLLVIKDIFNALILFSLFLFLYVTIKNQSEFKQFCSIFYILLIVFGLIVALQRIQYILYTSSYAEYYYETYVNPDRLVVDRNFALLPVFFGTISILVLSSDIISKKKFLAFNLLLYIFSICILLSGSKRGAFIFILIFSLIFLLQLTSVFWKNHKLRLLGKNLRLYFLTFTISLIGGYFLIISTSVYFKNNLLKIIGVQNVTYTKNLISQNVSRYVSFLRNDLSDDDVYNFLWHPVFDPKDPEAMAGSGNYKVVRINDGKGVNIVPGDSKGYLLDSTCLGFASSHHSYLFLPIFTQQTHDRDSILSSIYCYVSQNFNGDGVAFRAIGDVHGESDKFYEMKDKGVWKKLELPLSCKNGTVDFDLYMNKGNVKNFSNLKGFVIFAYPEIKSISKIAPRDLNLNCDSRKTIGRIHSTTNGFLRPDQRIISSADLSLSGLVTFMEILDKNLDQDPVRNWIARLVSEDTTYHAFRSDLKYDKTDAYRGDKRNVLWKFAYEIFLKEYNWKQKIIGGGFNFLNWYGYCFDQDKSKSDYPHNPFLHVLLYSGLLGLFIYAIFIFQIFRIYFRYLLDYPIFLFSFLIAFIFTFFSGGSPFDPPLMGFFVILPFFINSIQSKNAITKVL
ncbi:MAG: hypothetical protein LLG13_01100 [Bacteroidales bacterium]|nr:hypothetical protein [Bacteroidales bacterium]